MQEKIFQDTRGKMEQTLEHLDEELRMIRTGRASTSLVDDVLVPYYGTPTPLKQVASVTTPESNVIAIQPWDKTVLNEIESAIRAANLGVNPINDGQVVRIVLPPLTEERRKEYVKMVHQKAETARIALRTVRKEAWEQVQSEEKKGEITEDDKYRGEERLNKMIDEFNKEAEDMAQKKEKEIMTI